MGQGKNMKKSIEISDFMLTLYHMDALSIRERKFVEAELATNSELRLFYDDFIKEDQEILRRFFLFDLPTMTTPQNTTTPASRKNRFPQNRKLLGLSIAAAAAVVIFFAIFLSLNYFRGRNFTTESDSAIVHGLESIGEEQAYIDFPDDMVETAYDPYIYVDFHNTHEIEIQSDNTLAAVDNRRNTQESENVYYSHAPTPTDLHEPNYLPEPNFESYRSADIIFQSGNELAAVGESHDTNAAIERIPAPGSGSRINEDDNYIPGIRPDSDDWSVRDTQELISRGWLSINGNQRVLTIPASITSINDWEFINYRITNVVLPNGITFIGNEAFYNNPLTSVTIGANVTLGNFAFSGNFKEVYARYNNTAGIYTRANAHGNVWSKQ
jgi:hypothetical protein